MTGYDRYMENPAVAGSETGTSKLSRLLQWLVLFAFLVLLFFTSIYFSRMHTNGDQVHYTKAYRLISGLGFTEALNTYRQIIFSYEPMHFFISWVGSNLGFDKIILMSILNVLLTSLAYKYLKGRGYAYGLILLILLTNYYFFVIYFTLEKLKVAFIFLLLFLLIRKRFWLALISLAASLFAHFQMIILAALHINAGFLSAIKNATMPKKAFIKIAIYMACAGLLSLLLFQKYGSFIGAKVQYYFNFSRSQGLLSLRSALIAFFLTFLGAENKKKVIYYFIGLCICILFLGSDRLNMFAYFGFLHYINPKRIISKVSIVLLSGYLLYKTIMYLNLIYYFGG